MAAEETERRKLAAIMFTDMVGYSALAQRNEALALELLDEHRQLLRTIFAEHGGHEIKTIGDAFMLEFASPVEAVRCAIAIQQNLHDHNRTAPPERRLRIRIGVHLGDLVHRDGDVYGDGVNIAARIEPLAEPGGICVTQQIFDHVHNKLDTPLIKLGARALKNIQTPVNVYRVALPWTSQRFSIFDRVAFRLRQKRTRALLTALVILLTAAWASWKVLHQPVEKSIAVLPFVDLSIDRTNESLSDGFSEHLISALSQIQGLRIVPRASAFAFKGKKETVRRIGEQLQVATVLDGTVRVAGGRVQITAELVEVATGYNLWATNYDREISDVLMIQSEVAQRVVEALKVHLLADERQKLAEGPTENPEAFRRYADGRFLWNARTASSLQMGIQQFKQALKIDPNYALAYAGLAHAYSSLGLSAFVVDAMKPMDVMPLAEAAAKKALELDPSLADAHVALFFVRFYYDWNWKEAEKEIEEALRLDPRSAHAYHWHSHWLIAMGHWNESLVQSQKALKADPIDWMMVLHLAWHYLSVGDFDRAIEESKQALLMNPNGFNNYRYLGLAYEQKGEYAKAIAAFKEASGLQPDSAEAEAELGHAYAMSGQPDEARKILAQLIERRNKGFVSAYNLALICAGLGENSDALDWLEQAYGERSDRLVDLKVDRAFRNLHSDERFVNVLEKLQLGS